MKCMEKLSIIALCGLILALGAPVEADQYGSTGSSNWRWEEIQSFSPPIPGLQWFYALSGTQYPDGGELEQQVVREKELMSRLGQDRNPALHRQDPQLIVTW